jgi:hypothetical protein
LEVFVVCVKAARGMLLALLASALLVSLSAPAFAASELVPQKNDGLVRRGNNSGGDYEMERYLEGGVHLVCNGIGLTKDGKDIYISLTITTEDDAVIEITTQNAEIFDANNGRFVPYQSDYAWVGDTRNKREVIGGIPINGSVWYDIPNNGYELTELYPRVSFTFNGKKLTFRDVPALR